MASDCVRLYLCRSFVIFVLILHINLYSNLNVSARSVLEPSWYFKNNDLNQSAFLVPNKLFLNVNYEKKLEIGPDMRLKLTVEDAKFGEKCNVSQLVDSEPNLIGHAAPDRESVWLCVAPDPKNINQLVHLGHTSKIAYAPTPLKRMRRDATLKESNVSKSDLTTVRTTSDANAKSDFRTSVQKDNDLVLSVVTNASTSSTNKPSVVLGVQNELNDLMLSDSNTPSNIDETPRVFGIRVEEHSKGVLYKNGTIQLQAEHEASILLLGKGLKEGVAVQFTAKAEAYGGRCDVATSEIFDITEAHDSWAIVVIKLPDMLNDQEFWYLCVRSARDSDAVHQGSFKWMTISTYSLFLPVTLQIIILVLLLLLSGLFSGLNLGLMALDKTELKIVSNTGTPTERKRANTIEPVRRHGNFLLCTLLLGNVLVNSSLTILLDTLSSGLIAVIGSTIGIVIFGEIIPQAICSRHGLAIGAKTCWLVRIFMVLTGPVSWPISKLLDYLLGEEIGSTYNRERLKELVRVQDNDDIRIEEQNIIYGALELHTKSVAEIMTKIDDVFMLNIEICLDFSTINEIMQQGYSRIPIYENERTNIISVLFIKDLAFIDPDDNTPLKTLSQFYQNVCNFVFEDTTLDIIFKEFKEGSKGHMAFVKHVNNEGECDPFYEVIGLVTLEDVIEELIQEEIVDETDVFTDNKTKRRRKHVGRGRRDFKEFYQGGNTSNYKNVQISPQLQVAAFQFLRTTIEPFKEDQLSEGILKRMLNQDIIHMVKVPPKESENFLFVQGKPVDYFILILEGHVEVQIGKENLSFESGPFTFFGLAALQSPVLGESPSLSTHMSRGSIAGSFQSLDSTKSAFVPDYSVKASSEITFLKIRKSHYIAARRAFILEQSKKDPNAEENFEKEMEKILRSENLNSPVWEVEPEKDALNAKDNLLNGVTVRSKSDQEDMEISILRGLDNRRRSLRDIILPSEKTKSPLEPRSSSEDVSRN